MPQKLVVRPIGRPRMMPGKKRSEPACRPWPGSRPVVAYFALSINPFQAALLKAKHPSLVPAPSFASPPLRKSKPVPFKRRANPFW